MTTKKELNVVVSNGHQPVPATNSQTLIKVHCNLPTLA